MLQNRRALLALIIFGVIASYLTGALRPPITLQAAYYRFIFNFTKPTRDLATLKRLHETAKLASDRAYAASSKATFQSDSAKCVACHGDMMDRDEKGRPKHYIHYKMLASPVLNFSCTECHKKVDTRKRNPEHVTLRVDRNLCPKCHNPSSAKSDPLSSVGKTAGAPEMPNILKMHGYDQKTGRNWITRHPTIAMAFGAESVCRKCHIANSELDFCRVCHLRGGFRPTNHLIQYNVPVNSVYPDNDRTWVVPSKWKGYHFVFVRNELKKKFGVNVESPRDVVPKYMDEIEKLQCGACHVLKDWCSRCHIKHADNWLDPNEGHPKFVKLYGSKYCFRCHDSLGTKCVACHTYAGQLL